MKRLIRLLTFLLFSGAGVAVVGAAEAPPTDESAAYLEQIELRSVVTLRGETMFSISDPQNDRTFWISPGQTLHGLEVVGHDAEEESITLRHGETERELSLTHSRVRSTPEPPENEPETGPRRRPHPREVEAMREDMMAFRERWEAAAEDSPEIQALEGRMRETGEAMREVMMALAEAEEGSEEHRRLQEQRRELGSEMRRNFLEIREVIEDHPGFEASDGEVMDRMGRMAPGGPMGPPQ